MLNPDLPLAQLAERFQSRGRIQIDNVLSEDAAEALHRCLHEQVSWDLAFTQEGGQERKITAAELEAMDMRSRQAVMQGIHSQAKQGFAFIYNTYMMVTAYQEGRDPGLVLDRVLEFLNAEPYLNLLRSISGIDSITKSDCQATRYIPGHFLRQHNDLHPEQGREVAFVLNLTRRWEPDWGGLLQFLDDGGVVETLMPRFNSLTLFRVPQGHCVTYVAPFASGARYAITGWGRSR